MTKEQVIKNYVETVFSTTDMKVTKDYFGKLVEVALTSDGVIFNAAIAEIYVVVGYSSVTIAAHKVSMLRKMIDE